MISSANMWYTSTDFFYSSYLLRLTDFLEKYQLGQPSKKPAWNGKDDTLNQ